MLRLLATVLIVVLTGCRVDHPAQERTSHFDSDVRAALEDTVRGEILHQRLHAAYIARSSALLDSFLTSWETDTTLKPLTTAQCASDTLRALYGVFQAFADSFYQDLQPTIILPNEMRFAALDPLDAGPYPRGENPPRVLYQGIDRNFRPVYSNGKARILYFSRAYAIALHRFVRRPYFGSSSFNDDVVQEPLRIKFLSKRLEPMITHWGESYIFISQPEVRSIDFSADLSQAIVNYAKATYYGNSLLYKRTPDGWRFVERTGMMWVQ